MLKLGRVRVAHLRGSGFSRDVTNPFNLSPIRQLAIRLQSIATWSEDRGNLICVAIRAKPGKNSVGKV
jgi:hypothetical protein